ncbi:MAG: MerR family transcriptional regulator [Cyclobacteriaceae bacterium]
MSIYSIKDLEHLSGIKAHTIRIWEQRHNLFSPQRTDTNIRFYDDNDLKLLLNISLLKNHGIKISRIVNMTSVEIQQEVLRFGDTEHSNADQISALTVAMLEMNEEMFNAVLTANQDRMGFEKTMIEIIYPFFKKIGILWIASSINPAQEHFISHLVRQKLILETAKANSPDKSESIMLFLPEGELHEISLLFANCLLKQRGYKTFYLGQSVPLKDLEEAFHIVEPNLLFTVLTSKPASNKVQAFIDQLGKKFKKPKVLVTGNQAVTQKLSTPSNVHILHDFQQLFHLLADLSHSEVSK